MSRAVTRPPGAMVVEAATGRSAARSTHPWAWWGWALLCAATVSMVRNPLMLVLIVAAVAFLVVARRSDAPWARSVSAYFTLALVIIAIRVVLQSLFGVTHDGPVLFSLPRVTLPDWAAGIRIGGPVTLGTVLAALYDGLRLGAIIICVGAANALANPRRALKSVPPALHEVSVAVVIALTLAPQLVESLHRVRRSQRLRGGAPKGWRALTGTLVPVIEDAVERSLQLAASMEARGYGRTRDNGRVGRAVSLVLFAGVLLLVVGVVVLLGVPGTAAVPPSTVRALGIGCLVVAAVAVVGGLRATGRRLAVTRYRPDAWTWRETVMVASSAAAFAVCVGAVARNSEALTTSTSPLMWPTLPVVALPVVLLVLAPVALTQRAPRTDAEAHLTARTA